MLRTDPNAFKLLESMLWRPRRGFYLLPRHLARLRRSARYFGFRLPESGTLRDILEDAVGAVPCAGAYKVRLLVDSAGQSSVTVCALPPAAKLPLRIAVAGAPVDRDNPFLRHKTTQRAVYEHARAAHPGADDVLLWNQHGYVTETTIANLVFDFGDGIKLTPAAECGLLPGIYREHLLDGGRIREAVIPLETILRERPALSMINSVRRCIPVTLLKDNPRDAIDPGNRPD